MPKEGLTQNPQNPTYLGDGLYAEYDGYGVWLGTPGYTNAHSSRHIFSVLGFERKVYLEPEVYEALTNFVAKIKEANDGNRAVCTE